MNNRSVNTDGDGLDAEELRILDSLVAAHGDYVRLAGRRSIPRAIVEEWTSSLHDLQRHIYHAAMRRMYPKRWA